MTNGAPRRAVIFLSSGIFSKFAEFALRGLFVVNLSR
jgi:hypothetical protein